MPSHGHVEFTASLPSAAPEAGFRTNIHLCWLCGGAKLGLLAYFRKMDSSSGWAGKTASSWSTELDCCHCFQWSVKVAGGLCCWWEGAPTHRNSYCCSIFSMTTQFGCLHCKLAKRVSGHSDKIFCSTIFSHPIDKNCRLGESISFIRWIQSMGCWLDLF